MNPILVSLSGDNVQDLGTSFRKSVSELRSMGWSTQEIRDLVHNLYTAAIYRKSPAALLGSGTAVAIVTAVSAAVAAAAGGAAAIVNMVRTGQATKAAVQEEARKAAQEAKTAETVKKVLIVSGVLGSILILSKAKKAPANG